MAALGHRFLLGLDYGSGLEWGRGFDYPRLAEGLEEIGARGLGVVRLELPWATFQPEPGRLSDGPLRNLEVAMNLAASQGIRLAPVLFSGQRGDGGLPTWATLPDEEGGRPRDLVRDPLMREAQLLQLEILLGYFGRHRALLAWEVECPALPTTELAAQWAEYIVSRSREIDPHHPIAAGAADLDVTGGNEALLKGMAPAFDFLSLGWWGPARLAPLGCALALALTGKGVLVRFQGREGQPLDQELDLVQLLASLRKLGVLGALAPAEGSDPMGPAWRSAFTRAAGQNWPVEPNPLPLPLDAEGFYAAPQASWQALCQDFPGPW